MIGACAASVRPSVQAATRLRVASPDLDQQSCAHAETRLGSLSLSSRALAVTQRFFCFFCCFFAAVCTRLLQLGNCGEKQRVAGRASRRLGILVLFFERAIRLLWKRSGRERRAPSSEAETVGGGTMVATEAMGSLWYYVLATAMVAVLSACSSWEAQIRGSQKGGEKKRSSRRSWTAGSFPASGGSSVRQR